MDKNNFENYHCEDDTGKYDFKKVKDVNSLKASKTEKERIKYWLQNYSNNKEYSCGHFVYFLKYGVLKKEKTDWIATTTDEKTEIILLNNPENNNYHYVYFLPDMNEYISQLGNGGIICLEKDLDILARFFITSDLKYIQNMQK